MKTKITKLPELLYSYENGNYNVKIYENGTKVRQTEDDEFRSLFPENIDIKITDKCNAGCPWCHENSTKDGLNGNLNHPFLDSLRPGTELAIGGGNIFEHPEIEDFLVRMKKQGIIPNITVNQIHFVRKIDQLNDWMERKLVYGVGVSYNDNLEGLIEGIKAIKKPENIVVHVINGINFISSLMDLNLKVLILGYKELRRGLNFLEFNNNVVEDNKELNEEMLSAYLEPGRFKVLSFDNLALKQLNVKSLVDKDYWDTHFMGEDATATMFIDLVKNEFASSSTSPDRFSLDGYKDIVDIFDKVRI